jgi:hypothetical protein
MKNNIGAALYMVHTIQSRKHTKNMDKTYKFRM